MYDEIDQCWQSLKMVGKMEMKQIYGGPENIVRVTVSTSRYPRGQRRREERGLGSGSSYPQLGWGLERDFGSPRKFFGKVLANIHAIDSHFNAFFGDSSESRIWPAPDEEVNHL